VSQAAELQRLVDDVLAIAENAGRAIMSIYTRRFGIMEKSDRSPVTEADLAAHEIILEQLETLTPGLPILSEEDTAPRFDERRQWRDYWLVDPLDGTREFIKGNGEFSVNIALISDHRPIMGVVYAPPNGTWYFAMRGRGAFKRVAHGALFPIQTRSWDGAHIVVAGSRAHRTERFEAFLRGFESYDVICLGSSLKSCLVAEGKADIYMRYGATSEWDTAAAQCIVEEAGGRLMDLDLNPLAYNTKESLINPSFMVVGDPRHEWRGYLPES
jgi:3'(2'), 5'-bisphosphate nucleotidase